MFENKLCFQLIGSQYILLTPIDVLYLEADRQVCNITLADGTRIVAVRHLGYYKKELLQNFKFLELSKSILVNAAHLVKYLPRERVVHLGSGHRLVVSKTRQEALNKTFRQLHDNWLQGLDTSEDLGGATE
jgi:DNA-binding LytR/AlgR family response regulator